MGWYKPYVKTEYFKFAPGIPWRIIKGKYIFPKVNLDTWQSVMGDKDTVLLSFGGLLEAFYSLTILEALRAENPLRRLFWAGNPQFKSLYQINGLATKFHELDADITTKYPTPLFFSENGNIAYINALHNYLKLKDYRGYSRAIKYNKKPISEQIFDNSMMEWNRSYIPKLRNIDLIEGNDYKNWLASYGLSNLKRYIIYFPNSGQIDCLGWSNNNLKEFCALANSINLPIIIFDKSKSQIIRNRKTYFAEDNIMFTLIQNAYAIISADLDKLLISPAINNNAILVSNIIDSTPYSLSKNVDFIGADNIIYGTRYISPMDVFIFLKGLNDD